MIELTTFLTVLTIKNDMYCGILLIGYPVHVQYLSLNPSSFYYNYVNVDLPYMALASRDLFTEFSSEYKY